MPSKLELAHILSNSSVPIKTKTRCLKFICDNDNLSNVALSLLETFFKHLAIYPPPLHLTPYFLSSHYKLTANIEASHFPVVILDVEPLSKGLFFNDKNINLVKQFLSAVEKTNTTIELRIRDPFLSCGKIQWYDPTTTEMSIKWEDGGYTLRDWKFVNDMFGMMKRIGTFSKESEHGTSNSTEEKMRSM